MGPSELKPNSGRFVQNQFEALKKNSNYAVEYFYLSQDDKKGILKALRYPLFFMRFFFKYIFSKNTIKVIHVHFYFPTILLAVFYKIFRNPKVRIVVTFHGSDIYHYQQPSYIYRKCSYYVNQFIFVSEKLRSKFYRDVEAKVLSAGVLDLYYEPAKQQPIKKYDLIFVGHLDKNKGIDRLIPLLETINYSLNVAIVGEGDNQPELIKGNCTLNYLGQKSPVELCQIYNSSKFLINLSRNESFGLVMTEAMACGVPVIATDTDGAAAQVVDGINGFIWKNDETWLIEKATNSLRKIFDITDSRYIDLSKSARASAEQYKLANICSRLEKIYSQYSI